MNDGLWTRVGCYALGIALGAGIGLATGNLPVGLGGGFLLGVAIDAKRRKVSRPLPAKATTRRRSSR